MTKPGYIYHGVNEEAVPVSRVAGGGSAPGMVVVEILETVGSYKAGEWISVAWTRLEKVEKKT